MNREIQLIRSDRRSLSLQIKPDGTILVRAPKRMPMSEIRRFLAEKQDWIDRHLQKAEAVRREAASEGAFTREELQAMAERAMAVIPGRAAHYAALLGVSYGRITIRNQRTRWGSCSAAGNLNFNCLLAAAPPEVLDSVVAHELCHRIEMNHSERFYAELLRVFPEYWACHDWLKTTGSVLMRRMREGEG